MEQGKGKFHHLAEWIDFFVATTAAASYDVGAMRTAAGLASGAPLFVRMRPENVAYVNPHTTAVAPTGKTDGTGSVLISPTLPGEFYLDGTVTVLSIISPVAGTNISIEVWKT
jgi:hypothetical protein